MKSKNNINHTDDRVDSIRNKVRDGSQSALSEQDIHEIKKAIINEKKSSIVDRAYEKSGIAFFFFIKMPLKLLNIGSISDNQKILNDQMRALTSPVCPICGKGILMYNLNDNADHGQVLWFCGNQPTCNYSLYAKPSKIGGGIFNDDLREKLEQVDKNKKWLQEWSELNDSEKQDLIDSHLFKAQMYRAFSILMTCLLFVEIYFSSWMALIFTVLLVIALTQFSLKFCYYAYIIKTADRGFVKWLKSAEKFYSVE